MSTVENVKPAQTERSAAVTDAGWIGTARGFLTEVRNEMKRVTWPSRKEVYATTLVVIVTSAFFGLYLFGIDLALNSIVNWLFRRFGVA